MWNGSNVGFRTKLSSLILPYLEPSLLDYFALSLLKLIPVFHSGKSENDLPLGFWATFIKQPCNFLVKCDGYKKITTAYMCGTQSRSMFRKWFYHRQKDLFPFWRKNHLLYKQMPSEPSSFMKFAGLYLIVWFSFLIFLFKCKVWYKVELICCEPFIYGWFVKILAVAVAMWTHVSHNYHKSQEFSHRAAQESFWFPWATHGLLGILYDLLLPYILMRVLYKHHICETPILTKALRRAWWYQNFCF